jgi:hypothetical protein
MAVNGRAEDRFFTKVHGETQRMRWREAFGICII